MRYALVRHRTEMRAVAALPCCFLRVREGSFSGAAFCLSPWLCFGLLLLRPTDYFVQRRSSLTRRVGRCPTPCKGRCPDLFRACRGINLTPLGLCPRPRKGYAPLDGRNALRGVGCSFVVLRTENRYRSFLRVREDYFLRRCIWFVHVTVDVVFCFFALLFSLCSAGRR